VDRFNAYRNRQGDGYATTLKPYGLEAIMANRGREAKAKAEGRANFQKGVMDVKPEETWHYYSAGIEKTWEDWKRKGAAIMTDKSIDDPWQSTDPDAIQWQIEGARIKSGQTNINQAQKAFLEAQKDIGTRGDKYTQEYLDKVKNFPTTPIETLLSGQFDFPMPEFKNPAQVTDKLFVKRKEQILKGKPDGYVPADKELKTELETFFSQPENAPETAAFKQVFTSLPETEKDRYIALAEKNGFDEGWEGVALDQFKSQFTPSPVDLAEMAVGIAKSATMKKSTSGIEDMSGVKVTKGSTVFADSKMPDARAKSLFESRPYLLNDEATMAQLGIAMTVPFEKRQILAEKAFADLIRKNEPREFDYDKSRSGQGASKEEEKASYDKWRTDIGTGSIQAAQFTFKTKTPWGVVDTATIDQNTETPFKHRKALILNFADKAEAEKFTETLDDEAVKMTRHYQKTQDNVVAIPIANEYEQVLKQIHSEAVKQQGGLYERVGELDYPNTGTPSADVTTGQEAVKNVGQSRFGVLSKFPFFNRK